ALARMRASQASTTAQWRRGVEQTKNPPKAQSALPVQRHVHYARRSRSESLQPMNICRADKVLLSGGAALFGSAALFGATSLGLAIPAAAVLAVLADGVFRPSSSTFYPTISRGPRGRAKVALTFDDGPDPEVTPRVLDVLSAHGARATFFMIGRNLERNLAIGA